MDGTRVTRLQATRIPTWNRAAVMATVVDLSVGCRRRGRDREEAEPLIGRGAASLQSTLFHDFIGH
jgi:hypothetical protein